MIRRATSTTIALIGYLFLAACVTVNVYFPEAAIKDLSKQIEEQVREEAAAKAAEGAQPPAPQPPDAPKEGGGAVSLLDALLGATPAHADEVAAPEATSPAIRKIIDSRAARLADLNRYKAQGVIGENTQGLVEPRDLETLGDLKSRAEVQRLVKGENADRDELYKEIAAAKGVDPSQISKIRETYAATLRDNAKGGEWIQLPDGSWKKK
jgi:uncharacterized protein YdbL (DUF1318 family)